MNNIRFFILILSFMIFGSAGCGGPKTQEITVKMEAMRFDLEEIELTAGQPVILELINMDGYRHDFDIDELDVHIPLPAEARTSVTLNPTRTGTFTFYCSSPGHQAAGMVGSLVVSP